MCVTTHTARCTACTSGRATCRWITLFFAVSSQPIQMDTQGNLFNFFRDVDGEQKITPVGNVSELKKFKISEIAGVQLDRDVNVVAFKVRQGNR